MRLKRCFSLQFTFSNNVNNIFDYVALEYGGAKNNGDGNIVLYGSASLASSLTLTNSVMRNSSSYGLWLDADSVINTDVSNPNAYSNNMLGETFQN